MERRPREFAVGLLTIIFIATSVNQFRFDEMTTSRYSLAIERLLEPLSAAPRAEQFALRTAS